jgi:quercetin dioxygenase-like cupin family protein
MPEAECLHWDEVAPYGDAKADRRLIAGRGGDVKRVAVKAGHVAARHSHAFEQFVLVESGTGVVTWEGGEMALRPGIVIHFEPNAWHEARFETDAVLLEVNFREA